MTEIRFYHLERQNLEQVLPSLLGKALASGHRILVKAQDERQVERLNDHLWTYHPNSFLPHGSKKDGYAENQPIWLTETNENPNSADVLILTPGTQNDDPEKFSLCCEMLDGHNSDSITAARARWKTYKDKGFNVTYWQQGEKGWEKKGD